ncbi:MAG: hypothetical protein GXY48_10905 [Methanomicrobiales archaeon]|nr:hypothetical protein [Methanomicrobiales archaeon]
MDRRVSGSQGLLSDLHDLEERAVIEKSMVCESPDTTTGTTVRIPFTGKTGRISRTGIQRKRIW